MIDYYMPRSKITGILLLLLSLFAGFAFLYYAFFFHYENLTIDLIFDSIDPVVYYVLSIPIAVITLAVLGTGFWIGLTILCIKVVPVMPELIKKRDFTKPKALLLCIVTMILLALFLYGLYLRNFWAIALPASVITVVILGAVFWVGLAIITTRRTLPWKQENPEK